MSIMQATTTLNVTLVSQQDFELSLSLDITKMITKSWNRTVRADGVMLQGMIQMH